MVTQCLTRRSLAVLSSSLRRRRKRLIVSSAGAFTLLGTTGAACPALHGLLASRSSWSQCGAVCSCRGGSPWLRALSLPGAGRKAEEGGCAGLLCFDRRLWRVRLHEESHGCQRTGTSQVVPLDKCLQPPPARAWLVPARSVQDLTPGFGGCLLLWQGPGRGEAPVQHLVTLPSSRGRIFVSLCR